MVTTITMMRTTTTDRQTDCFTPVHARGVIINQLKQLFTIAQLKHEVLRMQTYMYAYAVLDNINRHCRSKCSTSTVADAGFVEGDSACYNIVCMKILEPWPLLLKTSLILGIF